MFTNLLKCEAVLLLATITTGAVKTESNTFTTEPYIHKLCKKGLLSSNKSLTISSNLVLLFIQLKQGELVI